MLDTLALILTAFLFVFLMMLVIRAIFSGSKLIGKPPVPVFFFILAKIFVVVNLVFLALHGLQINVHRIFHPPVIIEGLALLALFTGVVLLFFSTVKLNKDLIFGLSDSESHHLQTGGIYAISRHPFYLGFLFILFSSCLFTPNYINIIAFLGAWFIHHFIMIAEEKSLELRYGDEYRHYIRKVNRYINLKHRP